MIFSINKTELQNALSIVQKGVSTRSTIPVLSGIFMESAADSITFQATDLELSIQYTAAALVEEPGRAVLPGKLILDIVKSLPDAAVHISVEDEVATITCDNSSFSIKGLNPIDFPSFPTVEAARRISLPFETFSSMAKRVCNVVSRDKSRAILTGVLISLEGGTVRMVATDSYRLAVTEQAQTGDLEDFSAVIAGQFVSELASLPKTGDDILLGVAENQIVVSYHGTAFVNRLIEGNYPNYKQLLPSSHTTRAVISTSALQAAVKRAALLGQVGSSVRFSISSTTQSIQVSAVAQDVGSAHELVPAEVAGEDVEIAFNGSYVLEGLSSAQSDQVTLEVLSSLKPGILKDAGVENYLYLIMPVRLS